MNQNNFCRLIPNPGPYEKIISDTVTTHEKDIPNTSSLKCLLFFYKIIKNLKRTIK